MIPAAGTQNEDEPYGPVQYMDLDKPENGWNDLGALGDTWWNQPAVAYLGR